MQLTIVIPAYNESRKISRDLDAAVDYLRENQFTSEILVVDDGSKDNTREVVTEYGNRFEDPNIQIRSLSYGGNRGKGYAVRFGMNEAKGDVVAFVDSGLCVPFKFLTAGIEKIRGGADYAIASRRLPGTRIVQQQPLYRRLGSKAFWVVVRTLMGVTASDTQCGFKLYSQSAAKAIFSRVTTDGFMFDIEALMIANRLGLKGAEFAVEWSNDSDTRYRPVGGTVKNLQELINIRVRVLGEA